MTFKNNSADSTTISSVQLVDNISPISLE